MYDQSDAQLLRAYAEHGTEAAFAEIVARHTDLVYSAALRQVYSPDLARDVTQSVFTDLARKAREVSFKLSPEASLVGWLYRGTRFAARDLNRTEIRRTQRERQAMEQAHPTSDAAPDWEQLRPALDDAMCDLDDADRDALLLRYFKNHDLRTVGVALGISDDAAQKRVSRAVERLRELFAKRGVTVGTSGLAVVISANAVQAAPVGLALTISSAAALTGASLATAATATVTKAIAMTTLQKPLVAATIAALAGIGIYEARQNSQLRQELQLLQQQQASLQDHLKMVESENQNLSNTIAGARLPESALIVADNDATKPTRKTFSLAELEARLQAATALPESEKDSAILEIARLVPPQDSTAAIGIANRILTVYSNRELFLRTVLRQWADSDPKGTAEFVLTLPANSLRKDLLQSTLGTWAKSAPDAAIQFADTLPAGTERDWALCFVAYFWSGSDVTGAWTWATSLPAGESRVLSIQAILRQLATTSLNEAAQLAIQLSGEEQVRAVRALITDSAVAHPIETAAWVHEFPPGDARDKAVEMLVKRWAERDPVAASDWLRQQPQDKGFQDAARQLVGKILKVSPELAWDWALKLTDEKIRRQQLQYVANQWLGLDGAAAQTKIRASNLPASELEKLLAQPK